MERMASTVSKAIIELLRVVDTLKAEYPAKTFSLDGRLVGDIGEVLASEAYEIDLFGRLEKHHDGKCLDGRMVQIKATMKNALTFPARHVPDYYLGIRIHADGRITEVFNGPGRVAALAIEARKPPPNDLYSIRITTLARLSQTVSRDCRIPLRKGANILPDPYPYWIESLAQTVDIPNPNSPCP